MDDIVLWRDNQSKNVSGKYGVTIFPTTFLISKNGIISQRWENLALSSQLAVAIENETNIKADDWSTTAQTVFPGFNAARSLSDKIWMIDGGRNRKHGDKLPIGFLVAADQNVNINLELTNNKEDQPLKILNSTMEALPEDESKIILSNMPGIDAKVYCTISRF